MLAVITIFALSSSSVFGGESWHEKEFEIKANPSVVSAWLKNNSKAVVIATGGEVVSQQDNKLRLIQDTPKGIMDYTVEETIVVEKDEYTYDSKLIEVHKGLIEQQNTTITVVPSKVGSKVKIKLSASVADTKPSVIRGNLNRSIKGFQDMLERKFR